MDGNLSAVLVAVAAAIPATVAALAARKTHKEVQTNHGVRAGARIEKLTDDVLWLRQNVATQSELQQHAADDKQFQERVEPFLTKEN